MSAHTPGPWKVIHPPGFSGAVVIVGRASEDSPSGVYIGSAESLRPEREANARLFAESLELLAAMEELLNHCIGLMVNFPGECDPEKDDTIIKMRAVIAKATGEKL